MQDPRVNLDLIREAITNTELRLASYKQKAALYYNKRVKGRQLQVKLLTKAKQL